MTQLFVLKPYIPEERLSPKEAAQLLGISQSTVQRYARDFGLGRLIGGKLVLSKVATQFWVEEDFDSLKRYLAGDRSSKSIRDMYNRLGVELPAAAIAVAAE